MENDKEGGISKLKLALGAASLFFFLVGLKRTFRTEEGREVLSSDEPAAPDEAAARKSDAKPRSRRSSR